MDALLTSCGRFDLLKETFVSLTKWQQFPLAITIHEDSKDLKQQSLIIDYFNDGCNLILTSGIGQHLSIERFIKKQDTKYYLHLEDDFLFDNQHDWIQQSIDIMESDSTIIKVLARKDSQHPCVHDKELNGFKYGLLQPNWHHEGITWQGFSWNPGVTRVDLLKKFMPFRKWEQDVAEDIANTGYKVAELGMKVYTHIGDGRSTHA
jgi:hypothetical protein